MNKSVWTPGAFNHASVTVRMGLLTRSVIALVALTERKASIGDASPASRHVQERKV